MMMGLEREYNHEQECSHENIRETILRAEGLSKEFRTGKGQILHAISKIDLDIFRGETLGLVGESGCGKSTLARCLIHLLSPSSGKVY